jgi:DNA polymerase III alpha subunit
MHIQRRVDEWGRTIVDPNALDELVLKGVDLSALMVENSPLVDEYNEWCRKFDKLDYLIQTPDVPERSPAEEHAERAANWFISNDIQQIDVRKFLLEEMCKDAVCRKRVNLEMDMFEERKLVPLLQLMMFLVDHFRANKIVWGVGRGSSVASYVLFLIGVHKIDPIKYGLDVRDFLKD